MACALSLPYVSPRLRVLRVYPAPWERAVATSNDPPQDGNGPAPTPTVGAQKLAAAVNDPTVANALPMEGGERVAEAEMFALAGARDVAIEDVTGHALDAFYTQLARTENKEPGAVTRVLHYGDSVIASDYISGTMRRRLQQRFGDAGHGFVLIANAWQWYFHNDVTHYNSAGWEASRLAGPITLDGLYGVGGVSFRSTAGGVAYFGTSERGSYGRNVSRFDIYYLEQPGGGELEIVRKGEPTLRISTRGEAKVSRVHSVPVADGAALMQLRLGGNTRAFGVALERDVPGVVYDALGAHACMSAYWKQMDANHWKEQMDLRKPSLIVWQFGTNESDLWKVDIVEYELNLRLVLGRLKEAAKDASVLVLAPLDRAENAPSGGLQTKSIILKLAAAQQRVARDLGLGFWNTFEAMGGEGSMARWQKTSPKLAGSDLTHPTPAGAAVIGDLLMRALMKARAARTR